MAKGTVAKEKVTKIISDALGNDFIGIFDGKIYCWADDNGNKVQISIALTCPKAYRGIEETGAAVLSFEDEESAAASESAFKPADVTQEEQDTLAELLSRLGL